MKYIIYGTVIACIIGFLVSFGLTQDNSVREDIKRLPFDIIKNVVLGCVLLIVIIIGSINLSSLI